ncbi:MAG: two-component regulator propeller domain-containing protein [Anaerolineales bacterium]
MFFSSQGNVLRWDGSTWSVLPEPNSLYLSDLKVSNDTLWAHDKQSIYRFVNGKWELVFKAPGYDAVLDYVVDQDHMLWVAGYDVTKVWKQQNSSILDIPVIEAKQTENVIKLEADQYGNIYMASRYRIYTWDGENWEAYKDFGKEIQSFALIHNQPWVSVYSTETITDVYKLSHNEWKLIEGLNLDTGANMPETVTGIYPSSNGKVVWLTTGPGHPGEGVIRYNIKTGETIRITEEEGLADNVITDICEDRRGTLWFTTWSGISSYGP